MRVAALMSALPPLDDCNSGTLLAENEALSANKLFLVSFTKLCCQDAAAAAHHELGCLQCISPAAATEPSDNSGA
jgi:hypothetical protein